MKVKKEKVENPQPSLLISISIVVFLVLAFVIQVIQVGSPDVHMTLIFASAFAVILLVFQGTTLQVVEEGVIHGTKIATISMMILMFIGVMIPAWIAAGTIPTLIYYGLKIIAPSIFFVTTIIVCSISALATGTSWGTAATFGVALMGIGAGLGANPAITAGCIITGALFGDKLSPVSDTTNLSAGVCEVNLFDNIKSVLYTTLPGYILALVIAAVLGIKYSGGNVNSEQVSGILTTIQANFNITPVYALVSLLPIVVVGVMVMKKLSALATMVAAALTGMLIAILLQGYNIYDMMSFMNYGFVIDTGNFDVDKLMNRGGLQSMMWTVSIGYLGLSFGGILEKAGVLNTLLNSTKLITKNARNLVTAQMGAGILTIMLSASPYVAMLIPGRMFMPGYKKLGIKGTVCSRTLENSGVCVDPLIPWSLGAVYYTGVLGVGPLEYAPYAVLCWSVPIIALIYAWTGLFIWKEDPEEIGVSEIEEINNKIIK